VKIGIFIKLCHFEAFLTRFEVKSVYGHFSKS